MPDFLESWLQQPDQREELARELEEQFGAKRAVLALDLCGFSRTTVEHGVVAFLALIRCAETIAAPLVAARGGVIVDRHADNLLAVFDNVAAAVGAATGILEAFRGVQIEASEHVTLEGSIGIGFGTVLQLAPDWIAGNEVNCAAKLGEDVASEGQILLTRAAWAALDGAWHGKPAVAKVGAMDIPFRRLRWSADVADRPPAVMTPRVPLP